MPTHEMTTIPPIPNVLNPNISQSDLGYVSGNNITDVSTYSAEEQVIRQRGKRKKKALQEIDKNQLSCMSAADLFEIGQSSLTDRDPNPTAKQIELISAKKESLTRTPVRGGLRRNHASILPKLRKSDWLSRI